MGPSTVLPSYQKQGIGALLMKYSIEKANNLGYKGIIIFGNPDYYHLFGFVSAKDYNIQTSWGDDLDEFMALELYHGSLRDISGKFYEDEVFKIENDELEDFEKQFPFKEKHVTDTQLKL